MMTDFPPIPRDDTVDPLQYWGLTASYEVIRDLLDSVFTDRNESNVMLLKASGLPYPLDEHWNDEAYLYAYRNVACSQVAVGALAPLVESLFYRAAERMKKICKKIIGFLEHSRWQYSEDSFWNPSLLYSSESKENETNVLGGFQQLLKALGCEKPPKDLRKKLDALFAYRNAILHNGYDWPDDRLASFATRIESNKWYEWFRPRPESSSFEKDELFLFCMSDSFAKQMLEAIPELAAFLQTATDSLSERVRGS